MDPLAVEAAPLTREERHFRLFLGICVPVFGLTTLSFLLTPHDVGERLAAIGRWAGFANTAPPAPGGPWLPLSVSMMAMITVLCAMAWCDVRRHRSLVPILLVSKSVSSLVGLGWFFAGDRSFHCLVVFLTDFPLFLLTLVLYLRAAPAQRP